MSSNGKKGGNKGGNKSKELGVGIFAMTKEQNSKSSRKGGKIGGKLSCSQKWKCIETGFISNPGNLTKYQRARGIDTSKRIRIFDDTL